MWFPLYNRGELMAGLKPTAHSPSPPLPVPILFFRKDLPVLIIYSFTHYTLGRRTSHIEDAVAQLLRK